MVTQVFEVRKATHEDRQNILDMAENFLTSSPYRNDWDLQNLSNHIVEYIEGPFKTVIFLVERKEKPVGFLAAVVAEAHPFFNKKISTEVAWWIETDYRKSGAGQELLKAYEEWAKENGCNLIGMTYLTNHLNLSEFYEKNGYEKYEVSYLKRV